MQKCGTTWWYSLIELHPGVTIRNRPKELHYFDRPGRRRGSYADWFPRRPGSLCGEWTPEYMTKPSYIDALRVAAPDAKLFVLLRDPIERYRSGLTLQVQQRGRPVGDSSAGARHRGLYATHLEHVFTRYPREQVLVLQYEVCVADPEGQLTRSFAHLGLAPYRHDPERFTRKRNAARLPRIELSSDEREELVRLYEPEVARLHELVPELEFERWPDFAHVGR